MIKHPRLYEINTRIWLRQFDTDGKKATLTDVPNLYWDELANKGFHLIWLMGIWKTTDSLIESRCFEEGLVSSYNKALKDWTKEDVIGSPYAIDKYEINPLIGTEKDLGNLRKYLHSIGMGLILDFISNHFSADSAIVKSNPEIFLQCTEDCLKEDQHTFFRAKYFEDKVFAHGRDPFFPAWTDTIQINYYNPAARKFMINCLKDISGLCDGLRCDMAMLDLNNVFGNTWRGVIDENLYPTPKEEFWKTAIEAVKTEEKDFLFLAEAYWNLEWDLQQIGFDFTYDKKLLDRLKDGTPKSIRDHLKADDGYQMKSIRFIENHDEDRALTSLGIEKSLAAAIVISTIQGMRLYFDGQFIGKKIKLPLQLGREQKEHKFKVVESFYDKLISILKHDVFQLGEWSLVESVSVGGNNQTSENILAWIWNYQSEKRLVAVNYSPATSQARIKLDTSAYDDQFELIDLMHDRVYIRSKEDVSQNGLFVELSGYQSHIFSY